MIILDYVSPEQFGFLAGRQIHEAIGSTQEGINIIKFNHIPASVLKIELSKAFDRVS
jgi:hypothetical protein